MLDLHMHSVFSDGKDDLDALIENLKEAEVDYFSLTDHDTAEGCRKLLSNPEYVQKLEKAGMRFVPGVEFTGAFEGRNVHILAYDFDIDSQAIKEVEATEAAMVDRVNEYRWSLVEKAGIKFSDENIQKLKTKKNLRKMDFANVLAEEGYYPDAATAAKEFFKGGFPFNDRVDGKYIIETLAKEGIKVVWAHSIGGVGETPLEYEKIREYAAKMKELGAVGLECYYSLYTEGQIDELLKIADELGLYVSAGSDYHGKNKPVKLRQFSSDGTEIDESKVSIIKIFKNNKD